MVCDASCFEGCGSEAHFAADHQATWQALERLRQTVNRTEENMKSCHVFTYSARNSLMTDIAQLKAHTAELGCRHLTELANLMEIITVFLFRTSAYKDHQGLSHIRLAVNQMQQCFVKSDAKCQPAKVTDTIDRLWCWVDQHSALRAQ